MSTSCGARSRWSPAAPAASASRRPCGLKQAGFASTPWPAGSTGWPGWRGRGVHAFAMDVTDDGSMVAGDRPDHRRAGSDRRLVNNAGYGSYGAVEDVPLDEARRQFEVNLFGLARLVQLVMPHMRGRTVGPDHQHLLDRRGDLRAVRAWYHATKFAVDGFSDSLRVELRPFGIDVVIVHPAGIVTEWNEIARTSLVDRSKDGVYASQRGQGREGDGAAWTTRGSPAAPRWWPGRSSRRRRRGARRRATRPARARAR